MTEATGTEVTPVEEIQESPPQDTGEPGEVAGAETASSTEESLKAGYEKRLRDLQSAKDKAEAELKKRERSDLSEAEQLRAENEDLKAENQQKDVMLSHLYFKEARQEIAAKYKIPADFVEHITGSDEDELNANAKKLAEKIARIGGDAALQAAEKEAAERPPRVPSGSGTSSDTELESEIAEDLKAGNVQGAIQKKLFGRKK